jgi:hypothetical protein
MILARGHAYRCRLGPVDNAEPDIDRGEIGECEEAFGGLVVAGGDAPGVLKFVEDALDLLA